MKYQALSCEVAGSIPKRVNVSQSITVYYFSYILTDDCKNTMSGTEYRGIVSWTKNGLTCQDWDKQTLHTHSYTSQRFPNAGLMNNYCRSPDNDPEGPWCFTDSASTRWEYCSIAFCG